MFNSLLVPLDGSDYSEQAFAAALELARLSGAKVSILTVILGYKDAHVPNVPKLEDQTRKRAEAYLAGFADESRAAGFDTSALVAHGDPAEEIVRMARQQDADLIVMSTHGIGANASHALGSVAMKVLQSGACPVFMVPIPPWPVEG